MRARRWLIAIALGAAFVAPIAVRAHVVDRWALYLGSPAAPRDAYLFLDPFPDRGSCESRVRIFERNGERAFCAGHRELEFGNGQDEVLAAEFNAFLPIGWYCSPRHKKL